MVSLKKNKVAIWAITPNGSKLADDLSRNLSDADVYVRQNIAGISSCIQFQSLSGTLAHKFHDYAGHIFIMATGIVIRVIAPLIRSKTEDPGVVVVDDQGKHAISLLAGHLGGANALTQKIAQIINAEPVITTATDVNRMPAIDVLAKEKNLYIENPEAIKTVNMALLNGEKILIYDPYEFLKDSLPNSEPHSLNELRNCFGKDLQDAEINKFACVFVNDASVALPSRVLILRPASLVAGIGCNRNTEMKEIKTHLTDVLRSHNLASSSLKCIASIDVKADERGLIMAAENLDIPLIFFSKQELNQVKNIKNPSKVVEKHVGVKSVCEAAAILAARDGTLVVPKQSSKNVTVAIARIGFSS